MESGRRCQRWCSEPLSSSVLHQRRLSRHHKVWDLEDIEHLRTWPALCRSAPVPTGFAATPSAPRAVLRAQGAHTPLLHTTGSSLHISIDCGSVGAGGRRKLQHGGGLCGSGAASASGAAFNWERGQSVAPLSQIENRDESRLSASRECFCSTIGREIDPWIYFTCAEPFCRHVGAATRALPTLPPTYGSEGIPGRPLHAPEGAAGAKRRRGSER